MAHQPKRFIATLLLAFTFLVAAACAAADEQPKVNINTASAQELTALRGIGEKTAEAIVAYRESHGQFKSVDELEEVKGIGPKLMSSLRDHVSISNANAVAAPAANASAPKPKSGS